jgi:hypothetical protein
MAALVPQNGRGIRIFSKRVALALGEDLHHPVMEIIHRMILNRSEAAVIFLAGFVEITAQSVTDVIVLAAQSNLLGPQQLNVLHGNFGVSAGPAVQVSQVSRQRRKIESGRLCNSSVVGASFLRDNDFRGRFRLLGPRQLNGRNMNRRFGARICRLGFSRFDFGFDSG